MFEGILCLVADPVQMSRNFLTNSFSLVQRLSSRRMIANSNRIVFKN